MKRKPQHALELGPDVVKLLLPHRPPLLLVDRVITYERGEQPALSAERYITANEPVFAGHFPGLALWPGMYTIEGLAQTVNLVTLIARVQDAVEREGGDAERVLDALRNLDRGFRLQPGYRPDQSADELAAWTARATRELAAIAAIDVKLLQPVFAGQRLEYRARLTHGFGALIRADVEASSEGRTVARGTITGATGFAPPRPPSR